MYSGNNFMLLVVGKISIGEGSGSQDVIQYMGASRKDCSSDDSDEEEEKAFASMRKRRKIGRL